MKNKTERISISNWEWFNEVKLNKRLKSFDDLFTLMRNMLNNKLRTHNEKK